MAWISVSLLAARKKTNKQAAAAVEECASVGGMEGRGRDGEQTHTSRHEQPIVAGSQRLDLLDLLDLLHLLDLWKHGARI